MKLREYAKLRKIAAAAALFALAIGGQAVAAAEPEAGQHSQPAVDGENYRYQLFVPRAVPKDDSERKWPLMLFLHGSGERGDDIDAVKRHGPPKHADRDPDFPFILISPLLPAEEDWDIKKLERILDHALATLPVDPDRVYLTGLSRGGHATWRWGAADPDRFAALAPVAGRGEVATGCALVDIPIWAFHGDRDDVVVPEGSFAMARAIRACGGRKSRLTIYPDLGHNSWDPAYEEAELYLWLLKQSRKGEK